ncbi:helicase associated domain-containing protein [Streptomyces olivaceus]|uniref:helicase associated domain-containing protein n=1 Tax=Streptomyces olivaceus TaxID=47716 RepID=UPI0036DFCDC9
MSKCLLSSRSGWEGGKRRRQPPRARLQQFYEREGHPQVPRKHVEQIGGEGQEEREHKLGAWISNQRSRAATLTPERMQQLSAISWSGGVTSFPTKPDD